MQSYSTESYLSKYTESILLVEIVCVWWGAKDGVFFVFIVATEETA